MIKFIMSEYIEKMWVHIFIIVIFMVTMLAGGAMLGEVSTRTTMYKAVMDNIDENSVLLGWEYDKEIIDEIEKYGTVVINNEYFAIDKRQQNIDSREIIRIKACPDTIMSYMNCRLDEGESIEQCNIDDDVIAVYMSHNKLGIKAGDTVTICIDKGDGIHSVDVDVYIAGILSEGQKIYGFDGLSKDFNYTDLFVTYSYEQLGEIYVITSQKEMNKLRADIVCNYSSGILMFNRNLKDGQIDETRNKLIEYERERAGGVSFIENVLPSTEEFIKESKSVYYMELKKYIPMIAVIIIICIICLIGVISIKTDMNLKMYTIAYLCGMRSKKIIICNAFEIMMDVISAFILFLSATLIQNSYEIVGKINLRIDTLTIASVCIFGLIAILSAVTVSGVIVKKNTPVQILKSRM